MQEREPIPRGEPPTSAEFPGSESTEPPPLLPPRRRKRGCLFWGLITLLALFLLCGGCVWYVASAFRSVAENLFQAEAKPVEMPDPESAQGKASMDLLMPRLHDLILADETTTLQLTEREVNLLLALLHKNQRTGPGEGARVELKEGIVTLLLCEKVPGVLGPEKLAGYINLKVSIWNKKS